MSTWGATPAEWAHFKRLGLKADLLPVVSNPAAEISEHSRMKGKGKTPSAYNRSGKVSGFPDWTSFEAALPDIEKWSAQPDYGICLQTRRARALDVDTPDPATSSRIKAAFLAYLDLYEDLPTRSRPDSGKLLMAFELPGDFSKRSFKVDGGLVEFLATGQQFIAAGTHPDGQRYVWEGGLPEKFPVVTAEAFEWAWQMIVDEFAIEPERRSDRRDRSAADLDGVEDDVAHWLETNWDTYGSEAGKLFVACPWADGHSMESGETEAAWLLAGTRGYERGHFECLHASCNGRSDGEFLAAVGYVPASRDDFEDLGQRASAALHPPGEADTDAEAAALAALYAQAGGQLPDASPKPKADKPKGAAHEPVVGVLPLPGFVRDKQGEIEALIDNVVKAVAAPQACGVQLRYDTFREELMIAPPGTDDQWRAFRDADAVQLRVNLERIRFKPVGKELMRDALTLAAEQSQFDSAIYWLENIVPAWDGVPRIERFYPDYMLTADTPYTRAVGLYVWTAHAGRVLEPGVKADMVPVLIGTQGGRKSTAVAAISPATEFFAEFDLEKSDDDLARQMRGCLVGELGELKGLSTREKEAVKMWLSRTHEKWTPKFKEYATSMPRRLVFHGTGNERAFLDDPTGARRWLPMDTKADENSVIDVERIVADRAQLWAEGRERFRAEGVIFQEAERLARAEHAKFKDDDAWLLPVSRWLDEPDIKGQTPRSRGDLRTEDVLTLAAGVEASRIEKRHQMRMAHVLKDCGMVKVQRWVGRKNAKVWVDANDDLA